MGDVLSPSHPDFDESLRRWATNTIKRASLVIFPKTEEDVATAVRYAVSENLEIAIKGINDLARLRSDVAARLEGS